MRGHGQTKTRYCCSSSASFCVRLLFLSLFFLLCFMETSFQKNLLEEYLCLLSLLFPFFLTSKISQFPNLSGMFFLFFSSLHLLNVESSRWTLQTHVAVFCTVRDVQFNTDKMTFIHLNHSITNHAYHIISSILFGGKNKKGMGDNFPCRYQSWSYLKRDWWRIPSIKK